MIDINVPTVGESISEVTLVKWLKNDGDYVQRDEVLAELESEKATFEVNAEKAGVLKTVGKEGDTLNIGDLLAQIDETAAKPEGKPQATSNKVQEAPQPEVKKEDHSLKTEPQTTNYKPQPDLKATPVASAIIADKKVDPKTIQPSGFNGKILKDDVLGALANPGRKPGVEAFTRNAKLFLVDWLKQKILLPCSQPLMKLI
jgi:2-oxoglutarate dehydrogenase E2 component (dihydrolipoamide succinyltransferase)